MENNDENEKNKELEEIETQFFSIQDFIKENTNTKFGKILIMFDPEKIDDFQPKVYGNMNASVLQDFLLLTNLWIRTELRKQDVKSEEKIDDEVNEG